MKKAPKKSNMAAATVKVVKPSIKDLNPNKAKRRDGSGKTKKKC